MSDRIFAVFVLAVILGGSVIISKHHDMSEDKGKSCYFMMHHMR